MRWESSLDALLRTVVLMLVTLASGSTASSIVHAQSTRDSLSHGYLEPRIALNDPPRRGALAPEFGEDETWFNTLAPLHLKDLHGKFVILDFWTYGCINCIHILPELQKLETAYPNNVVVIGVHSGKFSAEHDDQGIRQAILRYGIDHPVVNDSSYKIWKSYGCRMWPTLVAIDPEGKVLAQHAGEIDFATLDDFLRTNLPHYRAKGALDERPLQLTSAHTTDTDTGLWYPGKVLADPAGERLFISDTGHHRILVTSLKGKLLQVIGSGKPGSEDGAFSAAQFNHPEGTALAGECLYVADTENHLVRKVDLENQRVVTIAGTGQQANPDVAVLQAREGFAGKPLGVALNSPWALLISEGDLYVAMAGAHQIWRMPLDESRIGPYAGNGREDVVNGSPTVRVGLAPSSFAQPTGLSWDGKLMYITDCEGSSVRSLPPLGNSGSVLTVVGTAALDQPVRLFTCGDVDGQPGTARLQHCMDAAYGDGQLYIADTYNHKIKVIDLKTRNCQTLAGNGKPGEQDGAAKSAEFFEPTGLSYANARLYVADTNNHRIRVIDLVHQQVSTLCIAGL
jgi:DNA-binding beta-propeller fold protein YncE